jgi:hypothetical protein
LGVALGVYEVFAYSVPGSLYLALILYVLGRTTPLDVGTLLSANTTLAVLVVVLLSFLLGHITYLPRRRLDGVVNRWFGLHRSARDEFQRRVPVASGQPWLMADPFLLQRCIELRATESAVEISRLRATGIALRSAGLALLLAAVIAAVEVGTGPYRLVAAGALVLFPIAAASAFRAGFTISYWATLRTYEVAFWIPEVAERFAHPDESAQPPPK